MSAVLSLWFSVVLLLLCGSSEGLEIITKEPGEDVTLTCRTENKYSLIVLEWISKGLGAKNVFVFRDGKPFPSAAHKSFRNRVFLKDSQMKNGNLSVVLKNVTIDDTGTYECKVKHENDPQRELKLISNIRLSVDPPGDPSPGQQGQQGGDQEEKKEEGGRSPEVRTGIVLSVLLLAAVVVLVVVGLWTYRKKKGPNQSSSDSNNQQEIELDHLNSDSDAEIKT